MKTWNLLDYILTATHRWYVSLAFILAGSLLGLGTSYVFPSPYRATLDLYVGLNAYRSPYDSYAEYLAGQSFRMVDDYKNWQMEQLESFVLTDPFMTELLERLQTQEPYWEDVEIMELRENMDLQWRNVGEWHLMFENEDPQVAVQVLETWGTVIEEFVTKAISHSKRVVALDIQMDNLAKRRTSYRLRFDRLGHVQNQLLILKDQLELTPENHTISSSDHWKILALVSQIVEWNPIWDQLLDDTPPFPSTRESYLQWLEVVLTLVEKEMEFIPGEISQLEEEFASVEGDYLVETQDSAGLASTLVIDRISSDPPRVGSVRPVGTMSLVGSMIGFLSWVFWVILKIDRKKSS